MPTNACLPRLRLVAGQIVLLALPAAGTHAQWVQFVDETSTRLVADPSLGANDVEEKDYAWGDVDQDGDIDLVVVRKEPFTTPGKRPNVLLMNENGVLVDRTSTYAAASDVPGDQGFLTPTNDRDVQLVDVNGDSWLDIVTATTLSDGDPKHLGHPRVYINLGNGGGGPWLGFRFENNRIPTMFSYTGQSGFNPRFCSVAAGDLTGDGRPELFFGDYDSSGAGGFGEPAGADYEDRLLINTGAGFFVDATQQRFLGVVDIPGAADAPFEVSAFGAAGAIVDMNGDGLNDVVKQTSLNEPLYVGIAYNTPGNQGFFDAYEVVNDQSPYFVSAGDLNQDSRLDLVITDDGADRYLVNTGNDPDGRANFVSSTFAFDEAGDDGFGSASVIADLNNDGWNDVLIADVDVDIGGCSRRAHIYRNLGGTVGSMITLQEQTSGQGCATGSPASCLVASIPADELMGTHAIAVFDINGDGYKDLVVGRCSGTQVYRNVPPIGLTFSYPQGLPFFVEPGQAKTFQVQIAGFGGAELDPLSPKMFAAVAGGPFAEVGLVDLGSGLYQATLPVAATCTQNIAFYFTAEDLGSQGHTDPPTAPAGTYKAVAALGTQITQEDNFEGDITGWTVVNDPSLTSGEWEQAVPIGTVDGGEPAAPSEDAEGATNFVLAMVTQNGAEGGTAATADVDGGPTDLISPPLNLAGTDGLISYSRWFYSSGDDMLEVAVSGDGSTWVTVEQVRGNANAWQVGSFRVGDYTTPTANVRVRFRASDNPNNSVAEAGIDLFRVEEFACSTCIEASECDDGNHCNGVEQCVGNICAQGTNPCTGQQCDEAQDVCVQCTLDAHCNDLQFCNGVEVCGPANTCEPGVPQCPGQMCDEAINLCVECLADADCDDGTFCNGAEACAGGTCIATGDACPSQTCDEVGNACTGTPLVQPRMGQPLAGLSAAEFQRFDLGRVSFSQVFDVASGLGPTFNQSSCGQCHNTPLGGSGSIAVTRFGRTEEKTGDFDTLESLGGSLLQGQAISPECAEQVPAEATVTAQRITPSTLGFGLVEAIPDASIQANATDPPGGVSGRTNMVQPLESPSVTRVGRFGWKSQVATVLSFSGDASLNEMGITNRLVPTENAPNGNHALLSQCDTVPDIEDHPDALGVDFVDRVTDFQRFLAPPPQTPRSGMTGEGVFTSLGCAACHTPSFTTSNDVDIEDAIRTKTLKPYSDFLVHDMGLAADFIGDGDVQPREVRTTPLWGLRVRDPLWHDGRIAGGSFAGRVQAAILLHRQTGSEAAASADGYAALPGPSKVALIDFLASLGRAEFDHDGDGDVDLNDQTLLSGCFTGPGDFYDPDDPCSVGDIDRDGDVDDADLALFPVAVEDHSGSVPDGAGVPGTALSVTRGTGADEVVLSWGVSCLASDTTYAVYSGTIGDFASHVPVTCDTGGLTTESVDEAGSAYFLVVPLGEFKEGSYGEDSSGLRRPPSHSACAPQAIGTCQ